MADVLVLFGNRPDVPVKVEQSHLDSIQEAISGKVYYHKTQEEAIEAGVDAEILFTWGGSGGMPENYCANSKNLKWVNSFSAGVNPILEGSIGKLPITLTNAKGIHGHTMGVTTIGYIISFLRHFPTMYRQQQAHVWDKGTIPFLEPTNLTVGIIGAGSIASEVARLCKAMNMKVLGVKRSVTPLEYYDDVLPNTQMTEVLAQSDFVVLLTPLSDETRNLIGKKELAAMKSSGILINIARGGVVNTQDLIEALQQGVIAGAALDAVEPEPLAKDSPLWDMENVIITPHCAADSSLYMGRAVDQFCENLRNYEKGDPLFNVVPLT